jgi:hypothetical protein
MYLLINHLIHKDERGAKLLYFFRGNFQNIERLKQSQSCQFILKK